MERSEALASLTAPGEPYELEEIELDGSPCRVFNFGRETSCQITHKTLWESIRLRSAALTVSENG